MSVPYMSENLRAGGCIHLARGGRWHFRRPQASVYSPSPTTIHVLVTRSTENRIRRDVSLRWLHAVRADLREHDRVGVRFLSHRPATEARTRCCLVSIIRDAGTCGRRTKRGAPTAQPHRRGGRSSRPHPPSTTEKVQIRRPHRGRGSYIVAKDKRVLFFFFATAHVMPGQKFTFLKNQAQRCI
jgi:hypothetical protein